MCRRVLVDKCARAVVPMQHASPICCGCCSPVELQLQQLHDISQQPYQFSYKSLFGLISCDILQTKPRMLDPFTPRPAQTVLRVQRLHVTGRIHLQMGVHLRSRECSAVGSLMTLPSIGSWDMKLRKFTRRRILYSLIYHVRKYRCAKTENMQKSAIF